MEITTKGRYDFIDGLEYKRVFIVCSTDVRVLIRKGTLFSETFHLKPGSKFECSGSQGKSFTIIPKNKKVEYNIDLTDK